MGWATSWAIFHISHVVTLDPKMSNYAEKTRRKRDVLKFLASQQLKQQKFIFFILTFSRLLAG
jgi:hypothetical protein